MTKEIEKAIEITQKYIDKGLNYNSAEFGTAVVILLDLAQQYLKVEMPQDNYCKCKQPDTIYPTCFVCNKVINIKSEHDSRLWQMKCLGKVEETLMEQLRLEFFDKPEFLITIDYKRIAQAIYDLFKTK